MTRTQALRMAKANRLKKLAKASIWVHHSRTINILDWVPDSPRSHP